MSAGDNLQAIKAHLHIDHDDDDDLILKYWNASVMQLTRNGIDTASDEGWLAAAGLTQQYYDGTPLQPGIQLLINGLKLEDPQF